MNFAVIKLLRGLRSTILQNGFYTCNFSTEVCARIFLRIGSLLYRLKIYIVLPRQFALPAYPYQNNPTTKGYKRKSNPCPRGVAAAAASCPEIFSPVWSEALELADAESAIASTCDNEESFQFGPAAKKISRIYSHVPSIRDSRLPADHRAMEAESETTPHLTADVSESVVGNPQMGFLSARPKRNNNIE